MMARERQLASKRVKGKVSFVVTSRKARSINNKLASLKQTFNKRKVDVCVLNELNVSIPTTVRGYTWFRA